MIKCFFRILCIISKRQTPRDGNRSLDLLGRVNSDNLDINILYCLNFKEKNYIFIFFLSFFKINWLEVVLQHNIIMSRFGRQYKIYGELNVETASHYRPLMIQGCGASNSVWKQRISLAKKINK